ncbi:hypothetical protein PV04_10614 [Phialophora macrospora]|uniref:Amidase domain-containing protein n=1 Tax=Phialophora macrospora TaxID=1851006 RepID=A0A0D2CBQ7_9EURO|nr:hypothetical protein PV04_10614 [Phialophora macrospora]
MATDHSISGQSDPTSLEGNFVMLPDQSDTPEIFQLPSCNNLNLHEISVDELQHHYASGALSASDYVKFCLDRIQKINPYLECVIETNPDALEHAAALDEERRQGRVRGPLHGIPVLIKDNIATADKMQTTAGSWALLGCIVPKDAHIVHLLRESGAVIIGKSNLDEWAGMRGSIYAIGYSARGGQTRNPYRLNRSANGSSSGSAASVSANIVPLAFGTETDCSVISPGMVCGVAAIKPTVGLTSRGGVIPISETQDSVGHYGRCVADVARALDVVAGPDPDDKFSTDPGRRQPQSYYACLTDRHALKGARFGLPTRCFWDVAPFPQRLVAEKVLGLLKRAGAEIVPVDMPCAEERMGKDGIWDWERYGEDKPEISEITVSKVQTYYLMNAYLSKLKNTPIKTLEDVVRFNDENRGSEGGQAGVLPMFPDGQLLFRKCLDTKGIKDETYHAALKHIQLQCRQNGIDAALKGYREGSTKPFIGFNQAMGYVTKIKTRFAAQPEIYQQFLELLQDYQRESTPRSEVYAEVTRLFTSAPDLVAEFAQFLPEPPSEVGVAAEEEEKAIDALLFCDVKAGGIQIAAQAGYPVMSIPIGLDPDGMPVPLTLQHTAWHEDRLIKWASAIEDLLAHYNEEHDIPPTERWKRLGRVPPTYMNHLSKNIPTDMDYRWPGRHRDHAGAPSCAHE